MVSRCCKQDAFAVVDYYVCGACHFPCAIVSNRLKEKDHSHEPRYESQVENSFNQT